ncbi:MAG: hypothetical protein ACJ72E_16225 [Marmoricola sp.]
MGKHSGEPEAEEPAVPLRQRLPALGAGMVLTVAAWGFLVGRAIAFGSDARHGQGADWFFVFLATVGATACMFVALILGVRIRGVLKGDPLRRRATTGGKRAAR